MAKRKGLHRQKVYALRRAVMPRDGFACQHCGRSAVLPDGTVRFFNHPPCLPADYDGAGLPIIATDAGWDALHLDHIIPYSVGGEHTVDNMQTLCERCNSRKGARV